MSPALAARLIWRDLTHGPHLLWIVAALAFGVATLAAVQSAREAVLSALARDAAVLLGGDVEVTAPAAPLTDAERATLPADARTSDVMTTTTLVRRLDDADELTIALKAVDHAYPLYGTVRLDPPMPLAAALADRGLAVGAGLLEQLDLAIGDAVRLGEAEFVVRARLVNEPDGGGGFQLGPRVLMATDDLAATGLLREGSVARFATRLALAPGSDPDAAVRAIAAANPEPRFRIESTSTSEPRIVRLVGRLATFLTLAALAALATGGLGMALAAQSHLQGKLATIATLRALGGRPAWVGGLYAAQLAVLGAVGIGLGLLLGSVLPYALVLLPAGLLPVAVDPTPSLHALVLAATIGALVLALFAWAPLARARRTSPSSLFRGGVDPAAARLTRSDRLTIALLATVLGALVVLTADAARLALIVLLAVAGAAVLLAGLVLLLQRAAGRLARIAPPRLRLPLREIARPGGETTPTVLALALGLGLLTLVGQTGRVLDRELDAELPERMASTVFLDIQPDQRAGFTAAVAAHGSAELLELVPYLRARLVRIDGEPARPEAVDPEVAWSLRGDRGLTWQAAPPPGETLVAGSWWAPDYQGPLQVAIPQDFAEGYGVTVGDTLGFNVLGRVLDAEIAAIRPEIDWGNGSFAFVYVFSPGILEAAPHGYIATVDVDPNLREPLLQAVREVGSNVVPIRVDEAIDAFARILEKVRAAVAFVAGLTLASGLVVLAAGLNAVRARQRYASAILKALGARRADLVRTFLVEHAALGTVAGLAGLILGISGAFLVAWLALGLPFVAAPGQALTILVLGLAVTTAAGLIGLAEVVRHPAQRLLRAG